MAGLGSNDLDLLLIGKTGNGKSAVGNSVLGRRIFRSKSDTSSVTRDVGSAETLYNGRVITVVDGPGVGDTKLDNEEAVNLIINSMERAIAINDAGYHAFLLVVRFGGRFTREDEDTIQFLKKIFGSKFVSKYCILVVACGDNFEAGIEENDYSTFEDWCNNQTGTFKKLCSECGYRAILFDNRTEDQSKKDAQLDNLIRMIDSLKGGRYTDENFEKAREARKCLMVKGKSARIEQEVMKQTGLILGQLNQIQKSTDLVKKVKPLQELLEQAELLLSKIETEDQGTNVLHKLAKEVQSITQILKEDIRFCQRMGEETAKLKEGNKKEMERLEQKLTEMEKKLQETEKRYREVRKESETGTVEGVVQIATMPLRVAGRGIDFLVGGLRRLTC